MNTFNVLKFFCLFVDMGLTPTSLFLGSDPQFRVYPSTLINNTIITQVSLYYLTQTVISSGFLLHKILTAL